MTGNGQIAIAATAGALPARKAPIRVEKAFGTSDLRDQAMREEQDKARRDSRAAARNLSRSETPDHAPLWYGPRLRPAFVAQVIGQVLNEGAARDPRSVFAAYEECAAGTPLRSAFDRRI